MKFTGDQVRAIRDALGLTGTEFATILGVHQSTIYRWEGASAAVPVEQLQAQLLSVLQVAINDGRDMPMFAEKLRAAMVQGNGLHALLVLLQETIGERAA
jgi:transcriptional regulator with XRE-family HTH domain